jgi:hypothetical protein
MIGRHGILLYCRRENENEFVVIDIYPDIPTVAFRIGQPAEFAGAFPGVRVPFSGLAVEPGHQHHFLRHPGRGQFSHGARC